MKRLLDTNFSRPAWGTILLAAAVLSVAGAVAMESLGLASPTLRPLSFVGAVVCVKLGLFFFWPVMSRKGREASALIKSIFEEPANNPFAVPPAAAAPSPKKPNSVALWDHNDPRVDVALFSSNIPTFVLNHEQRLLDWNPAFHLVFGDCDGIKRGAPVSAWFSLLENFKRVSKREEKLYGEGILPIADRERATFVSPVYGRMVFTKIMSPIVDRRTGRILGWTVVLNINSVNKRNEFLEHLYAGISKETRRIRHAAAYDSVLGEFPGFARLTQLHLEAVAGAHRVLDLAAGTGLLSMPMLAAGHRVTAVDRATHMLRKLRDKAQDAGVEDRLRIVKQRPDELTSLPLERYDAVTMLHLGHRLKDLEAVLASLYKTLKPGGLLVMSAASKGGSVEGLFEATRLSLEARGQYDELKHQLGHVLDLEREQELATPYRYLDRETLRAQVLAAGFLIEDEQNGLLDGHAIFLKARKL